MQLYCYCYDDRIATKKGFGNLEKSGRSKALALFQKLQPNQKKDRSSKTFHLFLFIMKEYDV